MRPFKPGLIYFLLVFALGWVLGPIGELWAVPRFGRITAQLFEPVFMLIAMILASRWAMRHFNVAQTLGSTIPTIAAFADPIATQGRHVPVRPPGV